MEVPRWNNRRRARVVKEKVKEKVSMNLSTFKPVAEVTHSHDESSITYFLF